MTRSSSSDGSDQNARLDTTYDAAIRGALHDVVVPDGLEQRLLSLISENGPEQGKPDNVIIAPAPAATNRWSSRRGWMLAAAAGLGGVAALFQYTKRPLYEEEIAASIHSALGANKWVLPWKPMSSAPDLPLPRVLRPRGWQFMQTSIDDKAVACDLTPGRVPAVLFTLKTARDLPQIPKSIPLNPLAPTGGKWLLSMWQHPGGRQQAAWNSNVLFVLASLGTVANYRRLIMGSNASRLA